MKNKGKTIYRARAGARINDSDASIIGRFCDRLVRQHGAITAEQFVEEAAADSKVRDYLEWNDDAAAQQWRLQQARVLMGSYTVTIERHNRQIDVRGLQFVGSQGAYVPASRVFSDETMTREVVLRARRDAISWFHRFQNVRSCEDVAGVFDEIEKLIDEELSSARHAAE